MTMMAAFNGLGMTLGSLPRLSRAKTRSISAENPAGEKGRGGMATEGTGADCARDLGQGWKVSPSVVIEPGQTYTIADIEGPHDLPDILPMLPLVELNGKGEGETQVVGLYPPVMEIMDFQYR